MPLNITTRTPLSEVLRTNRAITAELLRQQGILRTNVSLSASAAAGGGGGGAATALAGLGLLARQEQIRQGLSRGPRVRQRATVDTGANAVATPVPIAPPAPPVPARRPAPAQGPLTILAQSFGSRSAAAARGAQGPLSRLARGPRSSLMISSGVDPSAAETRIVPLARTRKVSTGLSLEERRVAGPLTRIVQSRGTRAAAPAGTGPRPGMLSVLAGQVPPQTQMRPQGQAGLQGGGQMPPQTQMRPQGGGQMPPQIGFGASKLTPEQRSAIRRGLVGGGGQELGAGLAGFIPMLQRRSREAKVFVENSVRSALQGRKVRDLLKDDIETVLEPVFGRKALTRAAVLSRSGARLRLEDVGPALGRIAETGTVPGVVQGSTLAATLGGLASSAQKFVVNPGALAAGFTLLGATILKRAEEDRVKFARKDRDANAAIAAAFTGFRRENRLASSASTVSGASSVAGLIFNDQAGTVLSADQLRRIRSINSVAWSKARSTGHIGSVAGLGDMFSFSASVGMQQRQALQAKIKKQFGEHANNVLTDQQMGRAALREESAFDFGSNRFVLDNGELTTLAAKNIDHFLSVGNDEFTADIMDKLRRANDHIQLVRKREKEQAIFDVLPEQKVARQAQQTHMAALETFARQRLMSWNRQ